MSSEYTHIDPDQASAYCSFTCCTGEVHVAASIVDSTYTRVMWWCGNGNGNGNGKLILNHWSVSNDVEASRASRWKELDVTGCLEHVTGIHECLRRRRGRTVARGYKLSNISLSYNHTIRPSHHNQIDSTTVLQQNTPHLIHETGLLKALRHRSSTNKYHSHHTSTATHNNRNHVIGHAIHRQYGRCCRGIPGPRSEVRSLPGTAYPLRSCATHIIPCLRNRQFVGRRAELEVL